MKEKYLPIGTVVMLKGGKKRVMICGYCMIDEKNQDIVYDYDGCMFPEGILNSNQALLFNHDQIEKIYFVGLEDQEEKEFVEKLKMTVNATQGNQASSEQNGNAAHEQNNEISDSIAEILDM